MQKYVGFASEPKERNLMTFKVQEDFVPGRQVNECSGNQIICNIIRKAEVRWAPCKNVITMSRAPQSSRNFKVSAIYRETHPT